MIRRRACVFLVVGLCSLVWSGELEIARGFWGNKYILEGREYYVGLVGEELKEVVREYPEAVKYVNNYGVKQILALICAGIGGYFGGQFLAGQLLDSTGGNLSFLGISCVGIGLALGLDIAAFSDLKKAAEIYNERRRSRSSSLSLIHLTVSFRF